MIGRWVTAGNESRGGGASEGGESRPPGAQRIPWVLITSTPADLFS